MIFVHDGRAHTDDFLAACVCRHKTGLPVFRRVVGSEILDDPTCWVLDQGRRFEPELHNFDHHQIEEEICSLTMVLDHLYGPSYRVSWPALRYLEIFDSYGPKNACSFAKVPEGSLEIVQNPICFATLSAFSHIEGEVPEFFLSFMNMVGESICSRIESESELFESLDASHKIFSHKGVKVLDISRCVPPKGFSHDQFPTKIWSKARDLEPHVILTVDMRGGGYRMVSVNTNSFRFKPNPHAYFTHNSGMLTAFESYEHRFEILESSLESRNGN